MPRENKNALIEVFRTGTFTPMGGRPISFSAEDLKAIADNYDFANSPAPIVVGHPKTNDPAFGWAEGFTFDEKRGVLSAELKDIEPAFADAVSKGRYKKVSLSFFSPMSSSNPKPGSYYPKHIGFLGAMPPAVSGLKPVSFAEHEEADILEFEGSMDFGSFDAENVGTLFRGIRDWLIETAGKEKADEVIPSWRIDWVNDLDLDTEDAGFAAPSPTKEKKSMPKTEDFAAREAELDRRQAELDARDRTAREVENLAFAESLVTDERLLPVSRDKVVAILNAADEAEATLSFADSKDEINLAAGIREVLKAQPKIVSFGAHEMGDEPEDGASPLNFAVADGASVEPQSAALDRKARAFMREHPEMSYMDAVSAVQSN